MPLTANKLFKIAVSDDRLTATLALASTILAGTLTAEKIVAELKDFGLSLDEQSEKVIAEFAQLLADDAIPEPVIVARGTAPQHDENGRVEILFQSNDQPPDDASEEEKKEDAAQPCRQSHYDRTNIITADKGQQLLRIIPQKTGTDGVDVYGKTISRKLARDAKIILGKNVSRQGDFVVADTEGQIEYFGDKITVNPRLEVAGNVDFSVGNIDFAGEVIISKNVLDLFKVVSQDCIVVHGLVEAAEIHAARDLHVTGGMAGKEKGNFSAGENIVSKYITNARVCAGGNIDVRTEVVNCDLICRGRLTVENGPLVGGHIVATGGVNVKYLGSDAGTKTRVEVGIDDRVREKTRKIAPEVELRRIKADKIRHVVEPLLHNQKHLNSEQKEKATELLYAASEIDDSIKQIIDELRRAYEDAEQNAIPEIFVAHTLFPGVTIRFPKVETSITKTLAGPLKIIPKKIDTFLRVVAINQNTHSVHDLGGRANSDPLWETLKKLLRPPTK